MTMVKKEQGQDDAHIVLVIHYVLPIYISKC